MQVIQWSTRLTVVALLAALAACGSPTRKAESPDLLEVETKPSVIDVQPLQDPAVEALRQEADRAFGEKRFHDAANYLSQALRIDPQGPHIWLDMAKVQLHRQRYQVAIQAAEKALLLGPEVGAMCSAAHHIIAQAEHAMGNTGQSQVALADADSCSIRAKQRL